MAQSTNCDPEVRVGRIERPAPNVQSGKVRSFRIADGRPFADRNVADRDHHSLATYDDACACGAASLPAG